jgi:D-beta-D-heptose 7-phosphate kinase/D-beta-D-heptose 1-phosphate adenosyltransferase
MKVLVIGESCKDVFTYGSCNRLCPEAPVPVLNVSGQTEGGGMAMNVKENLISLGAEVDIVTNTNWEEIVKTRFVDIKTNHMFMRIDSNDDMYGNSNINVRYDIDFSTYDAIVISDYDKGFLSVHDIKYISQSHDCTFLDSKKLLGTWCLNVSYIKINELEYKRSEGFINGFMKEKTIVTLGDSGCSLDGILYPVSEVEVKDCSGAGDTFIAGFVVKYLETKDEKKSIEFANMCATESVQRRGVG